MVSPPDPKEILKSRQFVGLLLIAAILGVPISAAAYWFLKLVAITQTAVYTDLPKGLGFDSTPIWWPLPLLLIAGVIVAYAIRFLPGKGGHSPADGFKAGGVTTTVELPGVFLAAFAGLSLGVVIGPEGPLIALGGGLAVLAVKLVKKDVPQPTAAIIAAVGSFAAISSVLGSPLAGAFLLLEASGLGGATATVVLVPGLLGAGIGSLIFLGLDALTGYGTLSLGVPDLPPFARPDVAQFGWALVAGVAAAIVCLLIRRLAFFLVPLLEGHLMTLTPLVGLAMGGLAVGYAEATGKSAQDVLFSGQSDLGPLIHSASTYSVGALLLLVLCKGVAYSGALSGFRGGPTFPAMFIGAAGGIAMSHLPGLSLIPGVAIGIGAMAAGMLKLPLSAVLLTTLFLGTDGITTMPLVIVAVVVSYVITVRLDPDSPAAVHRQEKAGGSPGQAPPSPSAAPAQAT